MPLIACPAIQESLMRCENQISHTGFLDFLLSDLNKRAAGFNIFEMSNPDGDIRTVNVKYLQRPLISEVTSFAPGTNIDLCTGIALNEGSRTIQPRFCERITQTVSHQELLRICDTKDLLNSQVIMNTISAFKRKINQIILTDLATLPGQLYGGGAPATVDLISAFGVPSTADWARIKQNISDLNCPTNSDLLFLIGENTDLRTYIDYTKNGCCLTNVGVDMSTITSNVVFMVDKQVPGILAPNDFIAIVPGMVQFVPYTTYRNNKVSSRPGKEANVLVDPQSGLTFDVAIVENNCNFDYNITLSLCFDLFRYDSTRFKAGDPLLNTTGYLFYNNV